MEQKPPNGQRRGIQYAGEDKGSDILSRDRSPPEYSKHDHNADELKGPGYP